MYGTSMIVLKISEFCPGNVNLIVKPVKFKYYDVRSAQDNKRNQVVEKILFFEFRIYKPS